MRKFNKTWLHAKVLARRADHVHGEKRKQLVERLMKELSKLDPFEGMDEFTIWLARFLARVKWGDAGGALKIQVLK